MVSQTCNAATGEEWFRNSEKVEAIPFAPRCQVAKIAKG